MMPLQEKQQTVNGIPITYASRKGKYDCRHLLVVFSGFGLHGNFTYDFKGASLDQVPSHVLWIKDDFFGNCCYYLCHRMDFSVEEAVKDFIFGFCREHFLDEDNITLLGGSKGASAALYFGLRHGFRNILAAAPQVALGSFLSRVHPDVAEHMMRSPEDVPALDGLLEKTAAGAPDTEKAIYLFTSPADQHETGREIHRVLKRFRNFNHIVTESSAVRQHNQITSYNLPLLLSVILANSQGIRPRLGEWVVNGLPENLSFATAVLQKQRARREMVAELTGAAFDRDLFFPEGAGFLRGVPSPAYGLFQKTLLLEHADRTRTRLPLGSTRNPLLSRTWFEDVYCDYSTGGFATLGRQGVSLADLPVGRYLLFLRVEGQGLSGESPLKMKGAATGAGSEHLYRLAGNEGPAALDVLPALSPQRPDICRVTAFWTKGRTVHYEGHALKYGVEARTYADITVWLVLKNETETRIFPYGKVKNPSLNALFDGCGLYQCSTFCSPARGGVDLHAVPEGAWDVFVTLQFHHALISERIDRIEIDTDGIRSLDALSKKEENHHAD